jgi:hypothetical protein
MLIPPFVAVRGGRGAPRRWPFVFLAAICGYGFLGLFSVLVWLPIEFIGGKVAAQLAVDSPAMANWVNPAVNLVYPWLPWIGLSPTLGFAVAFTLYLWRKWPRIAGVL